MRVVRHLWNLVGAGQLRFRMETFGLEYPAVPGRPVRLPPGRNVLLVLASLALYLRWLREINVVLRNGGRGWWRWRTRGTQFEARLSQWNSRVET